MTDAECVKLLVERVGTDFDGECHLTQEEAFAIARRLEAIANKLQRMEEALAGGYTLPTHMDCRFGIIDRDNGGKLIQQFDLEASLLANGDTITIPPFKITSA